MGTEHIAKVAVSSVNFAVDKPYDYRIPEKLIGTAIPGTRVIVPFSRGNRRTEGLILAVSEAESRERLKSIESVLDEQPVLSAEQISLALWMRERFFCTVYNCAKAMLPAGLWFKTQRSYAAAERRTLEEALESVSGDALAENIVAFVYASAKEIKYDEIKTAVGTEIERELKMAVKAGAIVELISDSRKIRDKTVSYAYLSVPAEEALAIADQKRKKSPSQAAALELLASVGGASVAEIGYISGASAAAIRNMEKSGLVWMEQREAFRRPAITETGRMDIGDLTAEQRVAFSGIKSLFSKAPAAALLYGVTGSGKTAIYIKLIRDTIERGRTALVLVPEIALTPQLVSTFSNHFGESVAVLHSSLGMGVQYDEWKRIKSGGVRVVVGTRSAVFAPLNDLGLIIIDEEQEHTYKSENSPRYHARDIAKYRAVQSGALLLLGTATPSIETMYSAKTGKYGLFTLESRFNGRALPEVIVADMKRELRQGNGSTISSVLREEIEKNLRNGEQTILFINRRGASNLITCPECGFTYGCPNCSVSLTYHSANKRVMCHYCGHSEPIADACPSCGGMLKHVGVGTQKVADELGSIFPGVGVIRMDTDTVTALNPHDRILSRFEKKRVPILVGTQMVTKGLNFENVTLVGVVLADQILYSGDYRAGERAFSLITQVVGRAGRGGKPGRAVIQTFTPNNELIKLAARQDYGAFYDREIELRRVLGAPPIAELFAINVSGMDETAVLKCCFDMRRVLRELFGNNKAARVLGPAPAAVVRVSNRYRYRILISSENTKNMRTIIGNVIIKYLQDGKYRGLSIFGDINPLD